MSKIIIGIIVTAVIIVGATFFFSDSQEAVNRYSINYAQIKVFDPVYIALEKGYFEEEGVTVNLKGETFGGPQALTAAASGDIDAGIAATTAIINARAAGIKVKGILDVQTAFEDSPLMKWYVLDDSSIKVPEDLKGKSIGVNTLGASFHYGAIEYLRQNGLIADEVKFIAIPHGNLEQALRSNQIDVAGMIDPFSEIAYARGGLKSLFTAYDVLGQNQFSMIFMSEAKMASDPEAVRRFSRGYTRAVEFIEQNPQESAKIISRVFDVDESYIAHHQFTDSAKVDDESIDFWMSFMSLQGVKDLDNVNAQDVGTNEYNQR